MPTVVEKTKLIGVILFTIGMHLGVGILDPVSWKLVVVLLIGNLCTNVGSYLMNPEKKILFEGEASSEMSTIERSEQVK